MNFKIFQIPSVYTIWDGLSLKTISRYCPFKGHQQQKGYQHKEHVRQQGLPVCSIEGMMPETSWYIHTGSRCPPSSVKWPHITTCS
jgi:hypothetical protein